MPSIMENAKLAHITLYYGYCKQDYVRITAFTDSLKKNLLACYILYQFPVVRGPTSPWTGLLVTSITR